MNVTTLKSELSGVLHGTNLNKIQGINGVINRAARTLLLDIDPIETTREVELGPIFDQVYPYNAPVDLKGNGVIDIKPQVQRTLRDRYTQTYSQEFDIYKDYTLQPNYTVSITNGQKVLNINSPQINAGVVLNECDTLSGSGTFGGTVSNITLDNVNYASGSGAIKFDMSTTGQYIDVTMSVGIDLTEHLNQSSLFFWVYMPDASVFTSATLRWGSDSSNYYSATATTQADGNPFQNGWNQIKVPWTTTTGSPDITDIDYLRVTFATDGSAITGAMIDQISSKLGVIMTLRYYSKYIFKDAITGDFQETVTDDSNEINLDTETYNVLFNLVALYCVQQAFDGSDQFDNKFFQDQYDNSLKRYKGLYKSEKNKPRVQYYRKPSPSQRRFWGRQGY